MGLAPTTSASVRRVVLIAGLFAMSSAAVARAESPTRTDSFPVVTDEALVVLADTQRALIEARTLMARLDEHAALQRLMEAERALRDNLALPGVHAWLAEVWLQMGLVAAQRGELGLADTLLNRALTLDPSRRLGAAEAAPPSVERAEAIARARNASPRSRFRIEVSPAFARVRLDGQPREAGAIEVDLAPGTHLLVVEAAGHRPYAALIEALIGSRSPIAVALSPSAETAERVAALPHEASPPPVIALPRAQTGLADQPETQRWWKRWPVWASAVAIVGAGAIAVGFAARDEQTTVQRRLRIDPGPTEP